MRPRTASADRIAGAFVSQRRRLSWTSPSSALKELSADRVHSDKCAAVRAKLQRYSPTRLVQNVPGVTLFRSVSRCAVRPLLPGKRNSSLISVAHTHIYIRIVGLHPIGSEERKAMRLGVSSSAARHLYSIASLVVILVALHLNRVVF